MFKVLVNYNFTPDKDWIGDDYLIYDRSDDGIDHLKDFDSSKIIKTENIGNVDYDKLGYLVDNYDNLPDVFLWGKTNLFKYITEEEWNKVKDNKTFTPLLRQDHKTYADGLDDVCYYKDGMYYERIDIALYEDWKTFRRNRHFLETFGFPVPYYIPFAPGGNYILTKEKVHKYPKQSYETLRSILPYAQLPGEAQYCERCYYMLWR